MITKHRNKTVATLLAALFGWLGVHRFYVTGGVDRLGLLHLCCLPITGILYGAVKPHPFYVVLPLLISLIVACITALVMGLMPDARWDARYNAGSTYQSRSRWPLALILVATTMLGAIALIGTLARLFDVLYTGGAYG